MYKRFAGRSIFVAAVCCLAAGPAAAEVFRCTAPTGATLYSDSPCPMGSAQMHEISAEVGVCATEACVLQRTADMAAARQRLLDEKAELARMQELRIRREEAWAKVVAAQQAAEVAAAAYAPPGEDVMVGAAYPGWYPHRRHALRDRPRHGERGAHFLRSTAPSRGIDR